jgi:hypothetical protein
MASSTEFKTVREMMPVRRWVPFGGLQCRKRNPATAHAADAMHWQFFKLEGRHVRLEPRTFTTLRRS